MLSNNQTNQERNTQKIRKKDLGPFKSKLNPVGIMPANFVSDQIIKQSALGFKLIIVTPNPFTYILFPLAEAMRTIYSKAMAINTKK